MNTRKVQIIGILLVLAIALYTSLVSIYLKLEYSEMVATAGLGIAVLAFAGVLYTLNATYIQLKKSMAKPELKLALNEDGNKEYQIEVPSDDTAGNTLQLWIKNTGNAIAKTYQVEIMILDSLSPTLTQLIHGIEQLSPKLQKDIKIVSFCSTEIPCFVNLPLNIGKLVIETNPEIIAKNSSFDIQY